MSDAFLPRRARLPAAAVVILAGVCAALHVGKLPPAIPVLQAQLGITLLQAGFLLSVVQGAGMSIGIAMGALADGLGTRRSMLIGLGLLALASSGGALARELPLLLALRVFEGLGFLLVVLSAPPLLRHLVAPQRLNLAMGAWSAFMPVAMALALWLGPLVIAAAGWPAWWLVMAGLSAAMAAWVAQAVPPGTGRPGSAGVAAASHSWASRLQRTLSAPGPWLVALAFAMYSGQWLAVIGFLPTLVAQGGFSAAGVGTLTALAAAANAVGNVAAGRALHRGVAPVRLLVIGYTTMGLAATAAFVNLAVDAPAGAAPLAAGGLAPLLRYAAVLLFSGVGGLIPGTLFSLALRAAPGEGTVAATVGWMQQWSALGQFAGPPLVAWVAGRAGGWHLTWVATGGCTLVGLLITAAIARHVARAPGAGGPGAAPRPVPPAAPLPPPR